MTTIAVLVGSSTYSNLSPLPCCAMDVEAIHALLEATQRYEAIETILDPTAAELKEKLRSALTSANEVFFYFSGHGHSEDDGEFFFCPKDFNIRRPNETGLSNSEFTALLRDASPDLAVKVVDACNSGTLMIKASGDFLSLDKGGLKNVVQIASCQDSQSSLGGEPLSEFTEKFCLAALRKPEGPIYYTDIIAVLRDEYLQDQERMPHFVFQASARQTLADDASKLSVFKEQFDKKWSSTPVDEPPPEIPDTEIVPAQPQGFLEVLQTAEAKLAKPADVQVLVNAIFDGLKNRLAAGAFNECFDTVAAEHSDYKEQTTRGFIIRILNQEKRPDEFVTASITKTRKKRRASTYLSTMMAMGLYDDDDFVEHWDLMLNMKMERAQLCLTLTPKFGTLQRIVLVVTCAPSLEHCYVFELSTRHPRTDWNSYAEDGAELTRRWYRVGWHDQVGWLVDKIATAFEGLVEHHLSEAAERLANRGKDKDA